MAQYDALAEIYEIWSAADPACVPSHEFYVGICSTAEGRVVELGVGTGRIALDVARAGKSIIGVDISSEMLDRCRAEAASAGLGDKVTLIEADARDFELRERASLITFPFRSIGHLVTQDDRRLVLEQVYQQLVPGGRFVFDHYVFDEEWARAHDGVPRLMHGTVEARGRGLFVWDIYIYDFSSQKMQCHILVERTDGLGNVTQRAYYPLTFSWVMPVQVRSLAIEVGFEVEALYGSFLFGPFNSDSRNQVWVLRRPL